MSLSSVLPKISVITPSFNQGQFLERTIQSVLCQNFPNLEYIIIDGGSTDNSVEIIKKYDRYLTYWVSEKDKGQSHAINKGFEKATGDILAWINSDDTYVPNALHIVADYFSKNAHVDFLYGDVIFIDEGGNLIKRHKELEFDLVMGLCIGFGLIIQQQSAFWSRQIYDKLGGLREDLHFYMDGEYWQRIALVGFNIKHIPCFLACYRLHKMAKIVRNKILNDSQPYEQEFVPQMMMAYQSLTISRLMPHRFGKHFTKIYKIKRIASRFIRGHYFAFL